MLKGTITLITGVVSAIMWAMCLILVTDRVFPQIMTMAGINESSPFWQAALLCEVLIAIILLIPWEIIAISIVYFFLRIIYKEREEWAT
jgi:hypothetical protein